MMQRTVSQSTVPTLLLLSFHEADSYKRWHILECLGGGGGVLGSVIL